MYIGIDLGGINIAVGLVDDNCNIIAKDSVKTLNYRPAEEIIKDMAMLCERVTKAAGISMSDVKCIGIGSPGTPDIKNKCILYASNLACFLNVYIEKELQKYFKDMPVYLENDANAAAYGEIAAGAARDYNDAVIVTLGTGIGGGIIINKKIYAGSNHAGGEIGHMVISAHGIKCNCGREGCFETYASATALIRQTAEIVKDYKDSIIHKMIEDNGGNISGKTAFEAARQGDEAGIKIVGQFVEYLGIGIVNLINIFQPEAIVIGGGISKEGDNLFAPLRDYVNKTCYGCNIKTADIIGAKLGNDAGIIGAAMLFKQFE